MRALLAGVSLVIVALATAASAQTAAPLPTGVSIPTILPTDIVYPNCPAPPTTFRKVWYFDAVNGQTQANGGDGSQAHPWKDLQALTGGTINGPLAPMPGYSTTLLANYPRTTAFYAAGPIQSGDEILLMNGFYGDLIGGGLSQASWETINNPAITIAAAPGQTPVVGSIFLTAFTGLVLDGFTVRSNPSSTSAGPLIAIRDGGVPGIVNTNIIIKNMIVQSDTVANALTWGPTAWATHARQGITIQGSGDGKGLTCASVVNTHVSLTHTWGSAGVQLFANNSLVQNNEIDHFGNSGIQFDGSNVAVLNNNIHDVIYTGPGDSGDSHTGVEGEVGNQSSGDNAQQSNDYISGNTIQDQIDPALKGQIPQSLEGIANYNGDWTNLVITWNKTATSGCWAVATGNAHNAIVANNLAIDGLVAAGEPGCNPEISAVWAHENTCCATGSPPSNVWLWDNVGPSIGYGGVGVKAFNNVATGLVGRPQYSYLFPAPTTTASVATSTIVNETAVVGQITLAAAGSGPFNIKDGMGVQTNEFVGVPAPNSYPMNPLPDWTLVAGSPAATNQAPPAPPTYPTGTVTPSSPMSHGIAPPE